MKTPSSPDELIALQRKDAVDAMFDLNSEIDASPSDCQRQALALAIHLLDYHEHMLKNHSSGMDSSEKVLWKDDFYNLSQAVKYLGRLT
jgi:hypothetical protein